MDADQFIRDFEEAIPGLEPGKITPQTVLNDIPEWDSMSLLNTMSMIDMKYKILIPGATLMKCRTMRDVIEAVRQHPAA